MERPLKIKVCGMRNPDNILSVAALQPDYMGFIFYPQSKRYADNLDPKTLAQLPETVRKTGVFVNASFNEIVEKVRDLGLHAVQLHGNEDAPFCGRVKVSGITVIKAFGIDTDFDFDRLKDYAGNVDYFLFDTKTTLYGGSGQAFNWDLLHNYTLDKPYFLSGGLDEALLESVYTLNDERLHAIDLNSRFETEPGLKDADRLKAVFERVRK
ncbi:phosphoribosylanthranilate isomerase [Pedobacter sp. BS3]|uniref:phosphoribosylanthranilate isomerase n=1 Tax=Pedobacter sp. BS3 TaxID=2567937 RepID=UPI0011EC317E|nr:phosphoribosylanthranilate isomerase [Pedobacter sp. BS3]TZF84496.1 phosphoribosylanthranilate isomerase [Pedobacter sp. BS3]